MRKNITWAGIVLLITLIVVLIVSGRRSDRPGPQLPAPVPEVRVLTPMDSLLHTFDSIVGAGIDSAGLTGAAVAVVYRGEVVLLNCYGVREAGTTDSVNANTIFRLASVSKPISGTLAGILSAENLLPLDTRVIDHLPGFRLKDSANTYMLNVTHLLSHTSGLVPHAYDNLVEAGVDFRTILDSLFRVNISAPPGELYGYQNVMFSIYDTIAEVATGTRFEQLMQEHLFGPFGMTDASVGYDAFIANPNRAEPHRHGQVRRISATNMRYFLTNPAAGVNASISDLAAFLKAMQGYTPGAIDTATISSVLQPVVRSPLRWNYLRQWQDVQSKHYALGWRIIGSHDTEVAYHGGYIRGYRAELALCREHEFGIAYLTNSPNSIGSGIVPLFMELYFHRIAGKKDAPAEVTKDIDPAQQDSPSPAQTPGW